VVSARLLRTADLFGLHDLVAMDVADQRGRWQSWSGIVSWWLLVPFGAVGWWRMRRRTGLMLLAPVISVFATAAVFYGAHRLRAPIEPVVALCAAVAIATSRIGHQTIDRLMARQGRVAAGTNAAGGGRWPAAPRGTSEHRAVASPRP
jgi:hypothetical protein